MDRRQYIVVLALCVSLMGVPRTAGQGRLQQPLGRSSVWRAGIDTPRNYDDHMLDCGGLKYQKKRGNQCGLCGDPVDMPRNNEDGGKYANDILTGKYASGQSTQFKVLMTSNRGGYMEFKVCPDPSISQSCFDNHPIRMADGSGYRYYLPEGKQGVYSVDVTIPSSVTCERCVLQWTYTGSDTWGVDYTGKECEGCGPQYELRNCADVSITPDGYSPSVTEAIELYNNDESGGQNLEGTYYFQPFQEHQQNYGPVQSHSPFSPPSKTNDNNDPWIGQHNNADPWIISGRPSWDQSPARFNEVPYSPPQAPRGRGNPDPWIDVNIPYAPPQTQKGRSNPSPWINSQRPNTAMSPPARTNGNPYSPPQSRHRQIPYAPPPQRQRSMNNAPPRRPTWNRPPPRRPSYPDPWNNPQSPTRNQSPTRTDLIPYAPPQNWNNRMNNVVPWINSGTSTNNGGPIRRNPSYPDTPYAPPNSMQNNSPMGRNNPDEDPWINPHPSKVNSDFPDPWVSGPGDEEDTPKLTCVAIGSKAGMEGLDEWCTDNCNHDYCPERICSCW